MTIWSSFSVWETGLFAKPWQSFWAPSLPDSSSVVAPQGTALLRTLTTHEGGDKWDGATMPILQLVHVCDFQTVFLIQSLISPLTSVELCKPACCVCFIISLGILFFLAIYGRLLSSSLTLGCFFGLSFFLLWGKMPHMPLLHLGCLLSGLHACVITEGSAPRRKELALMLTLNALFSCFLS